MFGKVFCLYLLLLLFVITVSLYESLSGMNIKTLDIWREINLGIFCLLCSASLFHVCSYAHYLANIVRYQRNLYEHTYDAFYLCNHLECKSRSVEKIMPPDTKYECSITADDNHPIQYET